MQRFAIAVLAGSAASATFAQCDPAWDGAIGNPGIIDGYGESFMSSLAFFAIALISSASVVMTVLTCMWGTAAGGAVLAIKSAQRARLQDGRSRGRRYIKRD